jgi:ribosomal protein S27E
MKIKATRCNHCKFIIFSNSKRHDVACPCGKTYVKYDGGGFYEYPPITATIDTNKKYGVISDDITKNQVEENWNARF